MTTTALDHEHWCLPTAGEDAPRIEVYYGERRDELDRVTSRPRITRCQECGAQTVTG